MKIYAAGGEGLTKERQKALFEHGCRRRLVSFFQGPKSIERVTNAAAEWQEENKPKISPEEKHDGAS